MTKWSWQLAAACLAAVGCGHPHSDAKGIVPLRIDSNAAPCDHVQVGTTGTGVTIVVWEQDNRIWWTREDVAGTWSPAVALGTDGPSTIEGLAAGNSSAILAWTDVTTHALSVSRFSTFDNQWSPESTLTTYGVFHAAVAVKLLGVGAPLAVVAWSDIGGVSESVLSSSTGWSAPTLLAQSQGANEVSAAVSDAGTVIAWDTGTGQLCWSFNRAVNSVYGGCSSFVGSNPAFGTRPRITINTPGTSSYGIVWQEGTAIGFGLLYSPGDAPLSFTLDQPSANPPAATEDDLANVVVGTGSAATAFAGSEGVVTYSSGGGDWLGPIVLTPLNGYSQASVAGYPSDHLSVAVRRHEDDGQFTCYVFQGSTPVRADTGPNDCDRPKVSVDAGGNSTVVYRKTLSGTYHVFATEFR
jgi:hypothetical protein